MKVKREPKIKIKRPIGRPRKDYSILHVGIKDADYDYIVDICNAKDKNIIDVISMIIENHKEKTNE
jgi:hypothetical protein